MSPYTLFNWLLLQRLIDSVAESMIHIAKCVLHSIFLGIWRVKELMNFNSMKLLRGRSKNSCRFTTQAGDEFLRINRKVWLYGGLFVRPSNGSLGTFDLERKMIFM